MAAGGGSFEDLSEVCFTPFARSAPTKARLASRRRGADDKSLEHVVESDIGPRLSLFHHEATPALPPEARPSYADVKRLAELVVGTDVVAMAAHFEKVCAQHHSYATLLTYFVAPAARLLGEFWQQDICDFFEVTIGVGRLQAFMDRLATPEPLSAADPRRRGPGDEPRGVPRLRPDGDRGLGGGGEGSGGDAGVKARPGVEPPIASIWGPLL